MADFTKKEFIFKNEGIKLTSSTLPVVEGAVALGPEKVKEIRNNDEAAINLARCLVMEYKRADENGFWQIRRGNKLYFDAKDTDADMSEIMTNYILAGEYEQHTTRLMEKIVKPDSVCVDAGASIGYFTLIMGRRGKKVYSFEPIQKQIKYLKRNIKDNNLDNVEVHPVGLSDEEGTIKINGMADGRDNAKVITLDSLNIPKVDIVKMDIDGSEPRALDGMIKTIERSPDMQMIIEYYPEYMEKLGNDPKEMLYTLDTFFDYEKIPEDNSDKYWNYYCKRK